MIKINHLLFVLLILFMSMVQAKPSWRIMIVAEDNPVGLESGHIAYQRANQALFEQLQQAGFEVISPSIDPSLPACLQRVCEGLSRQDLIAKLNASSLNIDLLVLYHIRYVEQQGAGTRHRQLSVPSVMIDIKTGRQVGSWDDDDIRTEAISPTCHGACLQARLSDFARQFGYDTGHVMAIKLQHYQRLYEYRLTFSKFARGELVALQRYMRKQDQANAFRNTRTLDSGRELLHQWITESVIFETPLSSQQFQAFFEHVLDEQGVLSDVEYGYYTNVSRKGIPYLGRYLSGLLGLFVVLYLLYGWTVYYRRGRVIERYAYFHQAQKGYDYVSQLTAPLLPRPVRWQTAEKDFLTQISTAEQCCDVARQAGMKGDYTLAYSQLTEAERLNCDNSSIEDLRYELGQWQQGVAFLHEAEALMDEQATSAAQKLTQAKKLNPYLIDAIDPLMEQVNTLIRQGMLRDTYQQLNFADLHHPYGALNTVAKALMAIEGVESLLGERKLLLKAKADFIASLDQLQGDVVIKGDIEQVSLFVADELAIGRQAYTNVQQIGLGFKRLSRMGKQIRLTRQPAGLEVLDCGSSNGSWLDGVLLSSKPILLTKPLHHLIMGGQREPEQQGICQLALFQSSANLGSLVMTLDNAPLALVDKAYLQQNWPSLQVDQLQTWVWMGNKLTMGLTDEGIADVGCVQGSQALIQFMYHEGGYWVEPLNDAVLLLEGVEVVNSVPLLASAMMSLNGLEFCFEQRGKGA